jgi:DNA-binding response OmpR family regulator
MPNELLVVEDDIDLQSLLEYTFENRGFEVTAFDSGADAWGYLESGHEPTCIVLDLMMPGVDGMDILRRYEESAALGEIPVVVLTAWESEDTVEKAFSHGADDYVTKPFSPNELVVRIRRLLNR